MNFRDRRWRVLLVVPVLAVAFGLIAWRGPDWRPVHDALTAMNWKWVVVAFMFNLLSVLARSLAWDVAIKQSMPPPHPRYRIVFSAFCVGLFGNAVLPGRVGELARVAVLRRHLPGRRGATPRLVGSVFAHRMFDLFPMIVLVVWVLLFARIPRWAYLSIEIALAAGILLFLVALALARMHQAGVADGVGRLRLLWSRARQGLGVMRKPLAAAMATTFQFLGWACQLFAVWSTMYAFHLHLPIVAAGLVLVLMNVATIFPLWPGNVGLTQAAIALPLVRYGVDYAHGFAFGIGLQLIEASVGIGIGLIFLAREGLSYAMLKQFEQPVPVPDDDIRIEETDRPERARARVSG
ncbi:MAG TPA: lysylphosphatidylglycerol synthase transmembrane domain-containing protein [Gaiellaceae bacterium]